jgi:2-dehydropantoate 2-reductase
MKIVVYGAGAIGGHLAVRFAEAGHAVGVVARGAQLDAILRGGLRLKSCDTESVAEVAASDRPAVLGPQELVVVTVKTTGLAAVAEQIAPLIGPDTRVMFLQNGMTWWYPVALPDGHPPLPQLPVFALADVFGAVLRPEQIVPGIVYSANEVIAPGVIRNTSPSRNAVEIGSLNDAGSARVGPLRTLLEAAGIASPPIDDVRAAVWLKLIVNASASSLAVVTGNPSAIACDPATAVTFLRIVDECLAVAAAFGYPLADRLDVTRWTQGRSPHKPSLLQDYEHGRPMELDEMVLAPLAFARVAGVATPTLDAIAAIAKRLAIDRGLYRPLSA